MIIAIVATVSIVIGSWLWTLLDGKYDSLFRAILITVVASVAWITYSILIALGMGN